MFFYRSVYEFLIARVGLKANPYELELKIEGWAVRLKAQPLSILYVKVQVVRTDPHTPYKTPLVPFLWRALEATRSACIPGLGRVPNH